MIVQSGVFYFFAAVLLSSAVAVITVRNPVHAALFLVLAFFTSAVIWLLLEAEFLGIALVLVYVGAVMVLFLFVVMMLKVNVAKVRTGGTGYLPLGVLVGAIMIVEMIVVINVPAFGLQGPQPKPAHHSNTQALGELLFTEYVYPFEIAGAILLVAIIAAIALTVRKRAGARHQHPSSQINVDKSRRVRLVSLSKEK